MWRTPSTGFGPAGRCGACRWAGAGAALATRSKVSVTIADATPGTALSALSAARRSLFGAFRHRGLDHEGHIDLAVAVGHAADRARLREGRASVRSLAPWRGPRRLPFRRSSVISRLARWRARRDARIAIGVREPRGNSRERLQPGKTNAQAGRPPGVRGMSRALGRRRREAPRRKGPARADRAAGRPAGLLPIGGQAGGRSPATATYTLPICTAPELASVPAIVRLLPPSA